MFFFSWWKFQVDLVASFVPEWIDNHISRVFPNDRWKWCRISLIWKTFYFIICSLDRFLSNILFWIESLNITHVPGRARSAFCCSFCICSTFSWVLYSWNVAYSFNLTFCSFCFVEMMIYINMDCISHCTKNEVFNLGFLQ